MADIKNFMRKELVKYIKNELDRGSSVRDIRKILLKAGHHHNMIEEAISCLEKHNFDVIKALEEPISDKLKKEFYYDVMNSLIKYIEYQLEHGLQIHEIEQELLKYGHSRETIIEAIDAATSKKKKLKLDKRIVGLVAITLILAFFVLSNTTQVALSKIILGLFPTLLTLIVSIAIVKRIKVKHVLWALPFLSVILFLFIATSSKFYVFRNMDLKNLAVVNLVISLFYVLLIIISSEEEND